MMRYSDLLENEYILMIFFQVLRIQKQSHRSLSEKIKDLKQEQLLSVESVCQIYEEIMRYCIPILTKIVYKGRKGNIFLREILIKDREESCSFRHREIPRSS